MSYRFVVKPSEDGQWVYQFVASNGQVMMSSETIHNQADAIQSCESVKRNSEFAPIEVHDQNGEIAQVIA